VAPSSELQERSAAGLRKRRIDQRTESVGGQKQICGASDARRLKVIEACTKVPQYQERKKKHL
jgi:hypothetical protein